MILIYFPNWIPNTWLSKVLYEVLAFKDVLNTVGDWLTYFFSRYDVSLNTVDMFGAPALLYAAQQQDSQSLQYLLGNLDNF